MPRYVFRLTAALSLAALIWILSYTLEPRRTAYSCRTLWSCIGLSSRHSYIHPLPNNSHLSVESSVLRDGATKYVRHREGVNPDILFLVLSKDAGSWSSDFRSSSRSPYDLVDVLVSTGLNLSTVSVAVATNSFEEYETIKRATNRYPFASTTVLLRQDDMTETSYQERHNPQVQLARRSGLATLRNYLMLRALQDEKHVVWLDADVVELSKDIVQTMISHSDNNKQAGIITALCHQNQMDNYDKNAWQVNAPHLLGPVADADRETAAKELEATWRMIPQLIAGTNDTALVSLDSVGGTILYMRADLIRQGLAFPPFNIVGTTWSQYGWVGVETEGICYLAKSLKGGGCFALGGRHHVRHTDWG